MCQHQPPCPSADESDRAAARAVARDEVLGWTLLCNGTVLFEDTGELLPDGRTVAPHRSLGTVRAAA
ncbi:DUF5999 family protein [Streptomyces hirsutus]|uniref:DUF5999 family protein n=1 Tax=Streptomyces TaxID=1883 RepID=UPI000A1EE81A|nr:DUF5999 family protein [Streptomyces sp. 13-12-16]OSP41641.1 hypothetical protein B7767_20270 [Streptomyces sp. 13-12-16]